MNIPEGYKLVPVDPTEEIIRSMLAVRWPATYRNALRFSCSGPATAAQTERDIAEAEEQFGAMLAAAPNPPQPIYDESKERELFESWANEAYGVAKDEELNMKNPAIKENLNGWLACAQSRAKSGEVGHE